MDRGHSGDSGVSQTQPPPGSPDCFLHCQHSTFTATPATGWTGKQVWSGKVPLPMSRNQDWASQVQDSLQGPPPQSSQMECPLDVHSRLVEWKPALARAYKPRSLPQEQKVSPGWKRCRVLVAPPGYHRSEHLGVESCPFTVRGQGSSRPSPTPLSTVSLTHRGDLITLCTVQTEVASHLSLGVTGALALTLAPA